MKFHKQLFLHEPARGICGDCFRTALACLLDLYPIQVPHFFADLDAPVSDTWAEIDEWLIVRYSLRLWHTPYIGELDIVLESIGSINPDFPFLLCGTSPRGTSHQVIAMNSEIIHDPHPDGGGLVGPVDDGYFWVTLLVHANLAADEQRRMVG